MLEHNLEKLDVSRAILYKQDFRSLNCWALDGVQNNLILRLLP